MKFKVPRIVKPLDLSDYAPEFDGATIWMWVNPPREQIVRSQVLRADLIEVLEEISKAAEDKPNEEEARQLAERMEVANGMMFEWWAAMFSQSKDPETHWTPEEVCELATDSQDTDPELWPWVMKHAYVLLIDHKRIEKKGLNGR